MGVLVEICCGSVEDAIEAEKGGAQRVELCSALELSGLTPSAATICEAKRLTKLPVIVMIRPRGGGFCYSEVELSTMERDIELALEFVPDGFVLGVLTLGGKVDQSIMRQLIGRTQGLPTVFHRAFDVTPNPYEALEAIIDLGMKRILTSGQKPNAVDGASLIQSLVERADGRIDIMPGGGVRIHNLQKIIATTGCREVHLSAHRRQPNTSTPANRAISFGSNGTEFESDASVIDPSVVAAIVKAAALL